MSCAAIALTGATILIFIRAISLEQAFAALILGCYGRAFKVRPEDADIPNFSWVWFNQTDADKRITGNVASLDALEGLPVGAAALADLDGDGDLDLFAVILKTADGLSPGPGGIVLLNDGTGSFSDSGQRLGGPGSASVALGDLDGDGATRMHCWGPDMGRKSGSIRVARKPGYSPPQITLSLAAKLAAWFWPTWMATATWTR